MKFKFYTMKLLLIILDRDKKPTSAEVTIAYLMLSDATGNYRDIISYVVI